MASDENGFVFIERRHSHLDEEGVAQAEEEKERLRKEQEADKRRLEEERRKQAQKQPRRVVHGQVDIVSIFETLATTALAQMGLLPESPMPQDLRGARNSIDMLRVLKDKTAGNLTRDEERILDELLYTLQMNYVQVSEGKGAAPPPPPPGK
ncbi:MAG: DUF1844 domain-containing protein [Nitrospirae bacterium]|nr:MAG: DUF1844 domain-containing protein [Nitrospirota bacterium]